MLRTWNVVALSDDACGVLGIDKTGKSEWSDGTITLTVSDSTRSVDGIFENTLQELYLYLLEMNWRQH
jgi:hypothetical protein